jgi:nanoRNase/pAp phosphatase (c-di-AMP/oligoRNAs hydrolase)
MALGIIEQIQKQVEKANNILICFSPNTTGDALASSIAFFLFLEKIGKKVDIVSDEFEIPTKFKFLSKWEHIKSQMSYLQKFIISIDIKDLGIEELNYDVQHEKLRIFVTPEKGFITEKHIKTAQTSFKYDLIITVDTPDLVSLGEVYTKHKDLFLTIPVINIDQHSENEHYGHINYTDIVVTSTAELIFKLIKKIDKEVIDKNIATALLTGVIAKTKSFKAIDTKPHTLSFASKLINLGGKRDLIIKNLYQTRTLNTLKLWGQALTHLQHDKTNNLVWTCVTREDFVRTGTNEYDLHDIIDDLIDSAPEAKIILLIYEPHHTTDIGSNIHVLLHVVKPYDAGRLVDKFGPVIGNKQRVSFILENTTMKETEETVIKTIKHGMKIYKNQ